LNNSTKQHTPKSTPLQKKCFAFAGTVYSPKAILAMEPDLVSSAHGLGHPRRVFLEVRNNYNAGVGGLREYVMRTIHPVELPTILFAEHVKKGNFFCE
jgi:hypothetical protein